MHDSDSKRQLIEMFNLLQRHFLGIALWFSKDGKVTIQIHSAFLFSVQDEWFLFTAGHCVDEVERAVSGGYQLDASELIDGMGSAPKYKHSIPFNYFDSEPTSLEGLGVDVGLLRVSANTRQLMEANSKSPITEQAWRDPPAEFKCHMLVGIPDEGTQEVGSQLFFSPSLYWVDQVARDDPFQEKAAPMLYGRVSLNKGQTNIRGTSGGPIFGFQNNDSGVLRYWLVAVQSAWNQSDRRNAAPRVQYVGQFMEQVIARLGTSDFWNAGS